MSLHDSDRRTGVCQCPECRGMHAFEEVTRSAAGVATEWDTAHIADQANEQNRIRQGFGPTPGFKTDPEAQVNRLPEDSEARKAIPLVTGLIDYFPNALAAVAALSKFGNDKHNPGEALHWTRGKSNDHANCIGRHLVDRGGYDKDGDRHSVMLAWRALALLEEEMEAALDLPISRGSQ